MFGRFVLEAARFVPSQVAERLAIKSDDMAPFMVRLMASIRQEATQNFPIYTPLLRPDSRVLRQTNSRPFETPNLGR